MKKALVKAEMKKDLIFIFFITFYFLYNSLHLLDFFYVHSDETWLIGLSKAMFDHKTFQMTEPFFDLYPRTIHGLRLVYVILQGLFIQLFQSSIYAGRFLSLVSGTLTLWLVRKWLSKEKLSFMSQMMVILFIGLQLQFLMTLHSARQESLILLAMVACLYFYDHKFKALILATITGLSIAIHPNSFLIFTGLISLMVFDWTAKKISLKTILIYVITMSMWAGFFIFVSLLLNKNFISEYINYGRSLGIVDFNISRTSGFYYYYYKIYHQIAGTYYLVNNRLLLLISFASYVLGFFMIFIKKTKANTIIRPFFMVTGINIGLIIIGRYNQTAIIFPLFFFMVLIMGLINMLSIKRFFLYGILGLMLIFQGSITYEHIVTQNYDQQATLEEAFRDIPKDAVILGNINLLNHFEDQVFYDYRNLWHLSGPQALDYIQERNINYIIWPEEMAYIYPHEKWHILYGPMAYYPDLANFLEDQTLVKSIESKTYGNRISRYVNTYPWRIQIYKVHSY